MGVPQIKLNFEAFAEFQGTQDRSIRAVFFAQAQDGMEKRYMVRYRTIEYLARETAEQTREVKAFRAAGISQQLAEDILFHFKEINTAIESGKARHSDYPLIQSPDYMRPNPFGTFLKEKPLARKRERDRHFA